MLPTNQAQDKYTCAFVLDEGINQYIFVIAAKLATVAFKKEEPNNRGYCTSAYTTKLG